MCHNTFDSYFVFLNLFMTRIDCLFIYIVKIMLNFIKLVPNLNQD